MQIDIDDPLVDIDDTQRYLYRDEPFTGELYENDRDGNLIASFGVLRGVRHGVHREWFPDGTLNIEFTVVGGSAVAVSREWHHNGVLAAEHEFDDRGDLVAVRRWADDGSPCGNGTERAAIRAGEVVPGTNDGRFRCVADGCRGLA